MLSSMSPSLPNFSRDNWKSTIRRFVNVHPDYASMNPWTGNETADLEYDDADGVFTSLLISKGYLDAGRWQKKKPRYYFEVKSTPLPCNTAFFMSGPQYEKVQIPIHCSFTMSLVDHPDANLVR